VRLNLIDADGRNFIGIVAAANQILAPSRPSMSRQQNQATHGSDTDGGAVKAAPKSPPSQQKKQRRHKNQWAPHNAIKILAVASAVTKSSMSQSKISDIEKIKSKTSRQARLPTQRQ
jgi:hypothetical protein